jgi:hypothetical protein
LNLTDNQYNRLQQGYQQLYNRSEANLNGVERLAPDQQFQRYQQWSNTMGSAFGQTTGNVLNQDQMSRWRQLELQHRGYGAFADPTVLARLNLNDNQVQQLNNLAQQYNAQLQGLYRIGQTDPTQAARQFELVRRQSLDSLSGILTPAQLGAWEQLTGRPFDLTPTFEPANAGAAPQGR